MRRGANPGRGRRREPTESVAPESPRRREITEGVLRILADEGVAALTMERLARQVGVTSGALFRHFRTREEMLDAAALLVASLLREAEPSPELPPLERLRAFVEARAALSRDRPAVPQLVYSDQIAKALPAAGARAVRGALRRTWKLVLEAVREGQEDGGMRGDLTAEALATAVLGYLLARSLVVSRLGLATGDEGESWRIVRALIEAGNRRRG